MISPQAAELIIKHFDAIDEAVTRRLCRKRPWSETALTSLLCDLLDDQTQDQESLKYSVKQLNADLAALDGLLNCSLKVETHEYDASLERWITQADIGLIIEFEDNLLEENSWTASWLLQAKRLHPSVRSPLSYTESSRFGATDREQHERMKKLIEVVGLRFVRYLLYCPRPAALDSLVQKKLAHLRTNALSNNIFDYALGLQLYKHLSGSDSSLAAGIFVCDAQHQPGSFGAVHAEIMGTYVPLSWFLTSHFFPDHGPVHIRFDPHHEPHGPGRRGGPGHIDENHAEEWACGIVAGDAGAVSELITQLGNLEIRPFPVLPPHTITVAIRVGADLNPNTRAIRYE